MPALFSYGTLQQREVQLANYGRELDGHSDTLAGYRLEQISIDDPQIVRLSGKSVHVIARQTGNADDQVAGTLFDLTDAELRATDDYEVAAYSRIEVRLESGRLAWVYVAV